MTDFDIIRQAIDYRSDYMAKEASEALARLNDAHARMGRSLKALTETLGRLHLDKRRPDTDELWAMFSWAVAGAHAAHPTSPEDDGPAPPKEGG